MAKESKADFKSVTQNADLAAAVPLVRHLPVDVLYELWAKVPCNLSKDKVFAAAVALTIERMQKGI